MMNILLAQLGAGGIAWLIFTLGLLWCSFSWWRVHRCKLALASACITIGTILGIITLIGGSMFVSFSIRGSGPGTNIELIGHLFLGTMILVALAWMMAAILFLISTIRLKQNPEDLFVSQPTQPSVD